MLRDEIAKLLRDQKVSHETIVQMKLDLKQQRRDIQENRAEILELTHYNDQANDRVNGTT